jgi:hypothetical protein
MLPFASFDPMIAPRSHQGQRILFFIGFPATSSSPFDKLGKRYQAYFGHRLSWAN